MAWLALLAFAPWPYGGVPDPVRYGLAAACCLAAVLGSRGTGDHLPVAVVAVVPVLQLATRTSAAPGETIDAAVLLLAHALLLAMLRAVHVDTARVLLSCVAMVGLAAVQSVFAIVQFVRSPGTVYGTSTPWTTAPFGSFVNKNHFAALAGAAAVVALGLAWREAQRSRTLPPAAVAWGGVAAGLTIAVLVSQSRGGAVALAIGLLAFVAGAMRTRRGVAVGALTVVVASLGLLMALPATRDRLSSVLRSPDGSMSYRAELAVATLRSAAARPVAGHGLGSFPDVIPRFKRRHGDVASVHAESDVLQFSAETGVLGWLAVAAMGLLLAPAVAANLRSRERRAMTVGCGAGAVVILAHEVVDFSLRSPAVSLTFVGCLAIASASARVPPRRHAAQVGLAVAVLVGGAAAWRSLVATEVSAASAVPGGEARLAAYGTSTGRGSWVAEAWRSRARTRVQLAHGTARQRHLDRAAADYEVALSWRPASAELWYELAWVETARGRPEPARRALQRAGELAPGSWALGFARAFLGAHLDGPRAGLDVLTSLERAAPDLPRDRIRRAADALSPGSP